MKTRPFESISKLNSSVNFSELVFQNMSNDRFGIFLGSELVDSSDGWGYNSKESAIKSAAYKCRPDNPEELIKKIKMLTLEK